MPIHVRDNRGGNWFWLHNAVLDDYGARLGPYGLAVYVALCRHAGQEQATWVGQRAIAAEIGTSREKVNREIARLRELLLVEVEEQRDERGRATNTYTRLAPSTPVTGEHRGVTQDHTPCDLPSHPLWPTSTAMKMNKNQFTRPMEQGDARTETIWAAAREELAATITATNYDRWIAPLELLELADGTATVRAPDEGVAAYLERRLAERLASILGVERVEVRVA